MGKNIYMHTIDGYPAYYIKGEQIYFVQKHSRVHYNEAFVQSLPELRRQQNAAREWRLKRGLSPDFDDKYDYIRIKVGY